MANSRRELKASFPFRACPGGSTTDRLLALAGVECDEGLCNHPLDHERCRNVTVQRLSQGLEGRYRFRLGS